MIRYEGPHSEPDTMRLLEISEEEAARLGIRDHDGWIGPFTTQQHEGAIENGAKIVKIARDRGDMQPVGATGRVLGSFGVRDLVGYFVEWDALPKHAVFVAGFKLGRSILQQ